MTSFRASLLVVQTIHIFAFFLGVTLKHQHKNQCILRVDSLIIMCDDNHDGVYLLSCLFSPALTLPWLWLRRRPAPQHQQLEAVWPLIAQLQHTGLLFVFAAC